MTQQTLHGLSLLTSRFSHFLCSMHSGHSCLLKAPLYMLTSSTGPLHMLFSLPVLFFHSLRFQRGHCHLGEALQLPWLVKCYVYTLRTSHSSFALTTVVILTAFVWLFN